MGQNVSRGQKGEENFVKETRDAPGKESMESGKRVEFIRKYLGSVKRTFPRSKLGGGQGKRERT